MAEAFLPSFDYQPSQTDPQRWEAFVVSRTRANALLLAATLMWGGGNVAQKIALLYLGPFTISGFRGLIGLVVILPLVVKEIRGSCTPLRVSMAAFLLPSLLFCASFIAMQIGCAGTSVTNVSFLINMTVLFTPAIAWIALRERPRVATSMAALTSAAGVFLMTGRIGDFTWGDGFCVGSAFLFSIWIVLVSRALRFSNQPFTLAACQFAVTTLIGLVVGLGGETFTKSSLVAAFPGILFLGIFSTGVAFTLQAVAQRWTSPSDAVVMISGECVFGTLAAVALLGERPSAAAIIGGALMVAAILLAQYGPFLSRAVSRLRVRHAMKAQTPVAIELETISIAPHLMTRYQALQSRKLVRFRKVTP